jgi:YD repeat-containing protein
VHQRVRVAIAASIFASLLAPVGGSAVPLVAFVQPARVQVTEPPRARIPVRVANTVRAKIAAAIRRGGGVRVAGWPMLRPNQIETLIAAARQAARAARHATPTPRPTATPAGGGLSTIPPGGGPSQLPTASPSPTPGPIPTMQSGTGINPWWRYQEERLPGGDRVMGNIGTGNVLLQADDMTIAHKGLAMAFRRTYNSQSAHDVNAGDAASWSWKPPGMYGNGWTNTFDAHLARTPDGSLYSVFDIDGTRYDFNSPAALVYNAAAGNHTTLAFDNACGYLWTKKSGTTYYFYRPDPSASCPSFPSNGGAAGGFAGRLYQIIGRNRNVALTFNYLWDGANASASGKISQISVQAESGMTATLTFADVNGHRLLQQLTYPDGATSVSYAYDVDGNLTSVTKPANNASGALPQFWYGYETVGTDSVMTWTSSPLWASACGVDNCGGDGGYVGIGYTGTSRTAYALASLQTFAVVNPNISDGGAYGPLQTGYPTYGCAFRTEYYSTGVPTPTFRDTDGHATNWVVDGLGRPTQTQECTLTANQGQQCTGTLLTTYEAWDGDNNLTSDIDPRLNESDYAYDVDGNTVAAAAPAPTAGGLRPTRLFSYDGHDNVTAYCDPNATERLHTTWSAPPAAPVPGQGGGLCPQSAVAVQYQWTSTADERFGELTGMTSPITDAAPTGYQRTFTYDPAQQGGALDYGLPTRVSGTPITQSGDRTTPTRQPQQTFWYDVNGTCCATARAAGSGSSRTTRSAA